MKKLILVVTFLISVSAIASDSVTKNYYIEGMTCGGCILGVKIALKKAEGIKFLEQNVSVGVANLKFNEKLYNGEETDCKVSKMIEKYTEYKVFLDKAYKKTACNQK